jgi:hypothetical protein
MIDPQTGIVAFMDPAYMDALDYANKLYQAGLIRPPNNQAATDPRFPGVISSAAWGGPGGFGSGEQVMIFTGTWNLEGISASVDFGPMIFPWGPNVTIENNDIHTLSANYASHTHDLSVCVLFEHAVEYLPPEAFIALTFAYFAEDGARLDENIARIAAGEPLVRDGEGTTRMFYTDYDIEIYDFFLRRLVFEPMDSNGFNGWFLAANDQRASFIMMHQRIYLNNLTAREVLTAFYPSALYAQVYNGMISEDILSDEQRALITQYTTVVEDFTAARAIEAARSAALAAFNRALDLLETYADLADEDIEVCDCCGQVIFPE